LDAIAALAARDFDDRPEPSGPERVAPASVFPEGSGIPRGYPASAGIAIGPARRFRTPDLAVPDGAGGTEVELAALDAALGTVGDDIARQRALVAGRADDDAAEIFDAHLLFL